MKRSRSAWMSFLLTRFAGAGLDAAVIGCAYVVAFLLRLDFKEPMWGWRNVALSFVHVLFIYLLTLIASGCYRHAWRRFRIGDLPKYAVAVVLATAALTFMRVQMPDMTLAHIRPPYSITLISAVFSFVGLVGWRMAWSRLAARMVRTEDLLEREVRTMNSDAAIGFLRGKTVMVTGAGGSIGSEIVRQVAMASPKLVLLVERGENALYEIDREMRQLGTAAPLKPLMVDINDVERMDELFAAYRPEIVLHAAAYKHVPMVELNPREGERNNVQATKVLAELARKHGVSRFVLISTDKAVNPISVMGKTKRAAEKAIMALNAEGSTSFCAVRFGNVLGSSGSVVPLFREQIERHLPVTVTHPDMKRYFMTIPEAVGLVLQAASRAEKAIYTLDMGKPVRILDLAEEMIRQAGYKPYVDIPIRFTGIRPGEKLFEELDVSEKSAYRTDMARIYITKTE